MEIEDYLDTLCAALTSTPLRRDEVRLEVHQHLRERADILMGRGMCPEEAESRAVAEFGAPEELADKFSLYKGKRSRNITHRPAEWVGVLLISYALIQCVYTCVSFALPLHDTGSKAYSLLTIFCSVLIAYLILGRSLLHHRSWARIPTLLLTLFNPWMLIIIYVYVQNPLMYGDVLLQPFVLTGLYPFFIGLYAAWAFFGPGRRTVQWA